MSHVICCDEKQKPLNKLLLNTIKLETATEISS